MGANKELHLLTASEIADGIAREAFTAEAVVASCLERIAARDNELKAWISVDAQASLAQARTLDRSAARGLLHGVPFGVKDVIDTADLPTQMGSVMYEGHQPRYDAACVALLKAEGGIVLGKTATAEFAGTAPPATVNPVNPLHTPGGSSSGSGAAVADFMVPAAFGTQTGGSTLRPASFCGVIGFKPTFGSYSPVGMKAAAVSFDTLGLITRSVADVKLFHSVLTGASRYRSLKVDRAPRIAVCRTHLWDTAQPETMAMVDASASRLAEAGAEIREVLLPGWFEQLTAHRVVVNAYERARGLAAEWFGAPEALSEQMQRTCAAGFAVSHDEYVDSLRYIERARILLDECFTDADVFLTPAAAGEAPRGTAYAGDPRFQELWTLLHAPTVCLPAGKGPNGLPVGIQFVAPRYHDWQLLALAGWAETRLR